MLSASTPEISSMMGQNFKNFGLNKSPIKAGGSFFMVAGEGRVGVE